MTEERNGGHLPPLCSPGGAIGEDCGNSSVGKTGGPGDLSMTGALGGFQETRRWDQEKGLNIFFGERRWYKQVETQWKRERLMN